MKDLISQTNHSIILLQQIQTNNEFVAFKKPHHEQPVVYSISNVRPFLADDLKKEGFVLCPFNGTDEALFLEYSHSKELNFNSLGEYKDHFSLQKELLPLDSALRFYHELNFLEGVEYSKKLLKSGVLQKVVLANPVFQEINVTNLQLIQIYNALTKAYPEAFVYMLYTKQSGFWIGATPEVLLLKRDHMLYTMALAGTQKRANTGEQPVWSQKEIEEQAYVSRYIINVFKSLRLREFVETGPKNHYAGHLVHLRTDYAINLNDVAIDNVVCELLNRLHPTSAVCGMPLDAAMQCIQHCEKFSRKYYTGFLGPVSENSFELYVNLRCAQLVNEGVVFWAGAGITSASVPEAELNETKWKQQVLSNFFDW